jgi:hypothetical protein
VLVLSTKRPVVEEATVFQAAPFQNSIAEFEEL